MSPQFHIPRVRSLRAEDGYVRVHCDHCNRSWQSPKPSRSLRAHIRRFHPEFYAAYRWSNELGELV